MLNKIQQIKWKHIANRKDRLLLQSLSTGACALFEKLTNIPWRTNYRLHFHDGDIFHALDEAEGLKQIFYNGGAEKLNEFRDYLIFYVGALDNLSSRLAKLPAERLSDAQIKLFIRQFVETALSAHNFVVPLPIADKALTEKILNYFYDMPEKQKQNWLFNLAYPIKENEHEKAQRFFYNLVSAHRDKNPNYATSLSKYLETYSWLGARNYFFENAWTKEDVEKRIENFIAGDGDENQEIFNLSKIKIDNTRYVNEILEKSGLNESKEFLNMVALAKEFSFLRTWRGDIIYRAGFRIRHLLFEAAHRYGMNKTDVVFLSFNELKKMAEIKQMPITDFELKRRKEAHLCLLFAGKLGVLSGKEQIDAIKKTIITDVPPALMTNSEIRGTVVYKGIVRGTAKILRTAADINKVNRGDIIIATMTFPNFVPAMEKAAAFVTDEGGILCHAAIVAREMKKPCVIGTKIATKIFKDGEEVEVNADEGIVKKI